MSKKISGLTEKTTVDDADEFVIVDSAASPKNNKKVKASAIKSELKNPSVNTQTASYTLVLTDDGKWIDMNAAAANNLTVPPNSSVAFPAGAQIIIRQRGAGATTIVAGSGVTLNIDAALSLVLNAQNAVAGIFKIATDTWAVFGNLKAA